MGLFSKPNLLTAAQMNRNDIKNPAFQKFLKKNPKLTKILDKREEVKEFFNTIKGEAGKDGLSESDLKSALYVLKNKGGSSISHDEIRGMAKEFFPTSSNPYIRREKPAEKSSQPVENKINSYQRPAQNNSGQANPVPNKIDSKVGFRNKLESGQRKTTTLFTGVTPSIMQ